MDFKNFKNTSIFFLGLQDLKILIKSFFYSSALWPLFGLLGTYWTPLECHGLEGSENSSIFFLDSQDLELLLYKYYKK